MAGLAFIVESSGQTPRPDGSLPSARRLSTLGVAFGTGANLVALRFVPDVIARFTTIPWSLGVVALTLLAIEQSLRWGVATWIQVALSRRGVPSAWAFATGIFSGTFIPAIFPWSAAGGVTPVPEMVQLAEVVGERGVTFLMALSAGLLASAAFGMLRGSALKTSLRLALVAVALPLLTFVLGRARMGEIESLRSKAPTVRIALVQPSIDARDRWNPDLATKNLARLTQATARAEHSGAQLTVWPEAAYPYTVGHLSRRCPVGPLALLPYGVRGPVLSGFVMTGGNGDLWNSVAICSTDGRLSAPQDKVHLLWFGETIPWLDRIPWVRAKFTRGIGLGAGEGVVLQHAGNVRASVLNCFEDTLPDAGRDAMRVEPNLLVNVTNDAWFSGSAESELHLRLATLRAVESRRDLVRAVNEGATSWIDAAGVVRSRTSGLSPDILTADAALLDGGLTLFDRWGDAPLTVLLMLSALLCIRKSRERGDGHSDKREKALPS